VRQLGDRVEPEVAEASADEVLDGLDVVPGRRLDLRELGDLGLAEVVDDRAQGGLVVDGQRRGREHRVVREEHEPLHLDPDAGAVEPRLGEVLAHRVHDRVVAPVERADRLRGKGGHGAP
jgi:hypothetical protein